MTAIPRAVADRCVVPAFYLALLLAWAALVDLLNVPAYIVPSPWAVAQSLLHAPVDGHTLEDIEVTLTAMYAAFAIAAVAGIALAVLITEFAFVEAALYPLLVALQSLPKIAVAPLILVWVGFGIRSEIALGALIAFFPVLVNSAVGLRAANRDLRELFDSLAASRLQRLWYLRLRVALPSIVAGLNVSLTFALLGAVTAELVGSRSGLGHTIIQYQSQFDTAGAFANLLILAAIGLLGHAALDILSRRLVFWPPATE